MKTLTALLVAVALLIPTQAQASPKIYEGKPAVGKFPHVVAIGGRVSWDEFSTPHCTGIAIAPSRVLTAAHCIVNIDVLSLYVFGMSSNITRARPFSVRQATYHPRTDLSNLKFDVAILHLTEPMPLRNFAKIAPPNTTGTTTAAGYGATKTSNSSLDLLYVDLPAPSTTDACGQVFATSFCVPVGPSGQDVCFGDSGGPIFQSGYLIGLTSWGPDTCGESFTQYTRLSDSLPWIRSVRDEKCNPGASEPVVNAVTRGNKASWGAPCGPVAVYRITNGTRTVWTTRTSAMIPSKGRWFVASIRPTGAISPGKSVFVK